MGSRILAVMLLMGGMLAVLPDAAWAVLATLTDDAYTSTSSPNANVGEIGSLQVVGTTGTTYIKFNVAAGLPSGVTEADVTKATPTLFADSVKTPGSFNDFPVTSGWTERRN